MFRRHSICRACGHDQLVPVFDLGVQPLANDFHRPGEECAGHAPLQLLFCEHCTLAQLSVVVNPSELYRNYAYVTSRSRTMQDHFSQLWQAIGLECKPESVLEIGSNDGHFLQFCRDHGAQSVLGIDPAQNLIPDLTNTGIASICGLFDADSVAIARSAMPSPDVIVARHVFAHVDDWREFIKNLSALCGRETLVAIEVPYVVDTLKGVEFDQVYHEHLSYVSVKAMAALLEDTPFHLHKIIRFDIHGGVIVMMLGRNTSRRSPDGSVGGYLSEENVTLRHWQQFTVAAHRKIDYLKLLVGRKLHSEGALVCGFGASAKSTVWINACKLSRKEIGFICDCTPGKQGALSPGSDIPIVAEEELMNQMPAYAICFAWNFADEIISGHQQYLESGGHFIVPGKTIEIVGRKRPATEGLLIT